MVGRVALVALVGLGTLAHAENPKLGDARKAIEDVRYNDAQPLLVAVLDAGGNLPDEVIEIYRLSASTAIVLGQQDVAQQFYRRWLALVPDATLPDTVSPKLRDPFRDAQAYMATRGALAVTVRRTTTAGRDRIDVSVDADPLAMIASIAIDTGGSLDSRVAGPDHMVHFDAVPSTADVEIVILDEHGNHLRHLPAPRTVVVAPTPRPGRSAGPTTPRVALVRRPLVWAIPALAFAAAGLGFAIAASRAQSDAEDILAHRDEHFTDDLAAARQRRDRDARTANLGFVAGGVCAATAVVMAIVRPTSKVTIAPATHPGEVGLVMSRRW